MKGRGRFSQHRYSFSSRFPILQRPRLTNMIGLCKRMFNSFWPKDVISSAMADTDADADANVIVCSSSFGCKYHVFLSFRGKDTRTNFTDHLYAALVRRGIHTFRDDDEIEKGENIRAEIWRAIRGSKVSVIVFSKDYASSTWCLDELVEIMECRKNLGLLVLPVFYNVDPSKVRWQTGSYAESFDRHEECFRHEPDRVTKWRAVLREVADLRGMALRDRHEAQFVQDIIQAVEDKLKREELHISPYLVGREKHIEVINSWIREESDDVAIAVISGIGGIGKTTICKAVFNLNSNRFEGSSFLANIRGTAQKGNGVVRLQKQLLSDILGGEKHNVYNADKGVMKIKDALCGRKVLLVLDDADDAEQFDAVIGVCKWIHRGSKVIITTRNEHLSRMSTVQNTFKIKELGYEDSLWLFCWHVFGVRHPMKGYEELSARIVHHCEGLPLALQILGTSLQGKNVEVWESALEKFKDFPNDKIVKILRISYDSLQDDHDRSLFLDMACFFHGMDKDYSVKILDSCGFHTVCGVQNLVDRCLLTIDENNKLHMHSLVRRMAWEVIRLESPEDAGRRSRLWRNKDAFEVLMDKTGTETVKGLTLDYRKLMEERLSIDSQNTNPVSHGVSRKEVMASLTFDCQSPSNEGIETNSFAKMRKLKLLQLDYVKVNGEYDCLPRSLIWLRWRGFALTAIPVELNMTKLVVLEMRYSSLKYLWEGTKCLPCLRILDLSHSYDLIKTPEFSGLPGLQILRLKGCTSLVELDESIGDLRNLVCLNLKGCTNLGKLPSKIGRLTSLEKLNLSDCSRLEELPETLQKFKSLKHLHLDGIAMTESRLAAAPTEDLDLLTAEPLGSLIPMSRRKGWSPRCFLPSSLLTLSIAYCSISDDVLMGNLSCLSSLENLDLSGNLISTLPESVSSLSNLLLLKLDGCKELRSLPILPFTLKELSTRNCSSLERLINIPNLSYSLFNFVGCPKLFKVPGTFELKPTTSVQLEAEDTLPPTNSARKMKVSIRGVFIDEKLESFPLQVLWKCGFMSIFLPGGRVSSRFSDQTIPLIAFEVPPGAPRVFGLYLSGVYTIGDCFGLQASIRIVNETKDVEWLYKPNLCAVPQDKVDMQWLGSSNFRHQFVGGDHVKIYLRMGRNFELKRFGIFLIFESEDNLGIAHTGPSWYLTSDKNKAWRTPDDEYDVDDYRIIRRFHLWWRDGEIPQKCVHFLQHD